MSKERKAQHLVDRGYRVTAWQAYFNLADLGLIEVEEGSHYVGWNHADHVNNALIELLER